MDQHIAAYEARVAAVPEAARRYAAETWGETWAHAEMGSLLDFAALAAQPEKQGGAGAGWKLVPVEPTEAMYDAGYDATRFLTACRSLLMRATASATAAISTAP